VWNVDKYTEEKKTYVFVYFTQAINDSSLVVCVAEHTSQHLTCNIAFIYIL